MKAIFITDLHLDGMTSALGASANTLILNEVARVESWALRNGIPHVFYLGDLGNTPELSYEAQQLLIRQWAFHSDYFTRYIIPGNHDYAEDGVHSLLVLQEAIDNGMFGDRVRIYTKPTKLRIEGLRIQMLPYPFTEAAPDAHLVLGHFAVSGSQRDNGTLITDGVEPLPKATYVCGHLHKPHSVGKVHYPGTLFQRDFGASLPKSFTYLEAEVAGKHADIELHVVPHEPAFTLTNLIVETADDLKKVTDNPLHKFKLWLSAAVRLPENFLLNHPNVIRHDTYRSRKELRVKVERDVVADDDIALDDPFAGLVDYFESTEIEAGVRERALAIANEISQEMEAVND